MCRLSEEDEEAAFSKQRNHLFRFTSHLTLQSTAHKKTHEIQTTNSMINSFSTTWSHFILISHIPWNRASIKEILCFTVLISSSRPCSMLIDLLFVWNACKSLLIDYLCGVICICNYVSTWYLLYNIYISILAQFLLKRTEPHKKKNRFQ